MQLSARFLIDKAKICYNSGTVAYLYETHLHTAGVSKCAGSGGADYITGYKDKGYSGIIVTDHFYNGYNAIPQDLPWKEWVNRFCRGYEEAREEGEKQGLDVFFGWEETFDSHDDYLVYGLDKQWLLEHPEVKTWTRAEQYHAVKAAGGCVVQAHPFRQRDYIKCIALSIGCVDAVEAANASNEASEDALAYRYAKKIGKPIIAGSDIHNASGIYTGEIFGVYLKNKPKNIIDFAKAVCNNEITGVKINPTRFDFYGYENITLPIEIRGSGDNIISDSLNDYI